MLSLIEDLIKSNYLRTERIIKAFRAVNRADFVPSDLKNQAQSNVPLPIGFGQTISQPLTVAFMLEILDPQPGQIILDIGSGSGWTTALLAFIVGEKGKVIAIERIPELFEFGLKNVAKYSFVDKGVVEMYCADGTLGFPRHAPYDRILVSASAKEIPEQLKKQLKIGGKMVIPMKGSLWLLEKNVNGSFTEKEYRGFVFVPLIHGAKQKKFFNF